MTTFARWACAGMLSLGLLGCGSDDGGSGSGGSTSDGGGGSPGSGASGGAGGSTQICECCGTQVTWPKDKSCAMGACDGFCNFVDSGSGGDAGADAGAGGAGGK